MDSPGQASDKVKVNDPATTSTSLTPTSAVHKERDERRKEKQPPRRADYRHHHHRRRLSAPVAIDVNNTTNTTAETGTSVYNTTNTTTEATESNSSGLFPAVIKKLDSGSVGNLELNLTTYKV